jgi:hypothetical protein
MSQPTVRDLIANLEKTMFAGFGELRDAMLHGFAQSEMRDAALGTKIDRLDTKVDRLETRVEHLETDVGAIKIDVGVLNTDMHAVKGWITRKDSKRS